MSPPPVPPLSSIHDRRFSFIGVLIALALNGLALTLALLGVFGTGLGSAVGLAACLPVAGAAASETVLTVPSERPRRGRRERVEPSFEVDPACLPRRGDGFEEA